MWLKLCTIAILFLGLYCDDFSEPFDYGDEGSGSDEITDKRNHSSSVGVSPIVYQLENINVEDDAAQNVTEPNSTTDEDNFTTYVSPVTRKSSVSKKNTSNEVKNLTSTLTASKPESNFSKTQHVGEEQDTTNVANTTSNKIVTTTTVTTTLSTTTTSTTTTTSLPSPVNTTSSSTSASVTTEDSKTASVFKSFNFKYLYFLLLLIPIAGLGIGVTYYCKRRKRKGYEEPNPRPNKTRRLSTPSWVFSEPDFDDEEVITLQEEKK